jgi:HEAT repeat protein
MMTQTIQPRSRATLDKPHKDLPVKKLMTKETMSDLLSLEDELNELQKELDGMIKFFNVLSDARTDCLHAAQKATQILTHLIQDKEKGKMK